jgi:hypothetical protein
LPLVVKTGFYRGKNRPGRNRFLPLFRQKTAKTPETWQKMAKTSQTLQKPLNLAKTDK